MRYEVRLPANYQLIMVVALHLAPTSNCFLLLIFAALQTDFDSLLRLAINLQSNYNHKMVIEFAGYDRPIGVFILSATIIFVLYYSLWIILVPLLNEDHIIPSLFPKISIGVLLGIPVAIGTTFFLVIALFAVIKMRTRDKIR